MQQAAIDGVSWLNFALASCVVLGLMALFAFVLKKLAERGILRPMRAKGRLSVVSSLPIDARRRLVLTRCDDMEYLLLIGAGNDLLLRAQNAPSPATSEPEKQ